MDHQPVEMFRRTVAVDFAASNPRHWTNAPVAVESILNIFSSLFPPCEGFFITAVRAYADEVTDPVLKEDLDRFVFQEGMHSRIHARCNAALDREEVGNVGVAKLATSMFGFLRRHTSRSFQLSVTCGIEHYTAILGNTLLEHQALVVEHFHPSFAAMWLWHAVEETEHKGVCYDLYRAVRGNGPLAYAERILGFLTASAMLVVAMIYGFLWNRRTKDPDRPIFVQFEPLPGLPVPAPETGTEISNPNFLWLKLPRPLMIFAWIPFRQFFSYFRPSHHPWDHDNRKLIERWKAKYADFDRQTTDATAPAA